jgi:head-tail adaptor
MLRAGELTTPVEFQAREPLAAPGDENGTAIGAWRHQFFAHAKLVPLRRSETVIAARLSGVQPYVMTIRDHTAAKSLATDWRVINRRTGETFNIRTVERDPMKRGQVECVIEAGPVDG